MQNEVERENDLQRRYIPAAGKNWRLTLYDPLCRLFGIDRDRNKLIRQAGPGPSHQILDIGCGTGTLILMIKKVYPHIEATGLDPDPKALARARRKTKRAGHTVRFDQGFSGALPYPPSSFDRVFSSYMLHHMIEKEQALTLHEVRRVLKTGGSFHLLDFEQKEGVRKSIFANSSRYPAMMKEAGLSDARRVVQKDTLFGGIGYYQATRM